MFPCQPEYLLRMTQSLASSLPSAANQTLSIKNVLWTHLFSEWLGWPIPLGRGDVLQPRAVIFPYLLGHTTSFLTEPLA